MSSRSLIVLRDLWNRWLVLAQKIGKFQSRIVLTVAYFVIVLPFGLGVRLLADPLRIRRQPADASSNWSARQTHDVDLDASHRQF
jgi:hypothetical protein